MLLDSVFGPWLPDMPAYNNPGVTTAFNVTPGPGAMQGSVTYEPLRAAKPYYATAHMDSRPLGTAIGKDRLGNARVYAGNATKLYKINPATNNWQNISRATAYTTSVGERWESAEYLNGVYFTNFSNEPQWINKNVDLQFADVTTLMRARHIDVVKDFLVVGNTYDSLDGAVPYRVRWSGLGLPLSWDFSQTTGADFQDVAGYGAVQAIVGGENGWLLMEQAVVKMTYTEYPYWFRFDRIPFSKGCAVAQSVIKNVEGFTYFLANDGFYAMNGNTGQTTSIGGGKIDKFFLNSVDTGRYDRMTVAADPQEKLIYWSYCSKASSGKPDRTLIYNYLTGDWSLATSTADYIFNSLSLPWTIEQMSVFGSVENIPAPLDSPLWAGGNAMLWAMNDDGSIHVFGGDVLPAVIETGEQALISALKQMNPQIQGDRVTVSAVRPLFDGDGGTATVNVGSRTLSNGAVKWSSIAKPTHAHTGFAYFRDIGRYHRFRVSLSGAWTKASSLQIDAQNAGWR